MYGGPSSSKSQSRRSKRSPASLTFTLHAAETACNAVISNSLGPNVVGMARTVERSAGMEGGVTCRVPQREEPPNVAAPAVSSASVIASSSVSWRRRAIRLCCGAVCAVPERVCVNQHIPDIDCPEGRMPENTLRDPLNQKQKQGLENTEQEERLQHRLAEQRCVSFVHKRTEAQVLAHVCMPVCTRACSCRRAFVSMNTTTAIT
jgi:hypothetical protein